MFAVGDVHGCLRELEQLLDVIQFDTAKDQLIFVGDLADRGPNSVETINFVLDKPYFHIVAGNHEELLVNFVDNCRQLPDEMQRYWLSDDGKWVNNLPPETLKALSLRLAAQAHYIIEAVTNAGERFGITHAGHPVQPWFDPNSQYDDDHIRSLAWSRGRAEAPIDACPPVKGIDYTLHGHTIFPTAQRKGNSLFIDTGCYCGGKLTAVDLESFARSGELNETNTYTVKGQLTSPHR